MSYLPCNVLCYVSFAICNEVIPILLCNFVFHFRICHKLRFLEPTVLTNFMPDWLLMIMFVIVMVTMVMSVMMMMMMMKQKVALLVVLSIARHSWALVSQQYFIKKSEDYNKIPYVLKNFIRHA